MIKTGRLSSQTRTNWMVDAVLFLSALVVSLSGIYFLFLPVGGRMGGRNQLAGISLLFTRHTWDDIHTWSGVLMIAVIAIHLPLHWDWVVSMTRRMLNEIISRDTNMNGRGRLNLWLNIVVAISFLLAAISGVYFLFFPGGQASLDPYLLFSRYTWDMIHTWSGVVLIIAAVLHFAIHWKWVTKVSRKVLSQLKFSDPQSVPDEQLTSAS